MKISIDTSPLSTGHKYRGVGVYTENLINALKKVDKANEYSLTKSIDSIYADLIHYPYFDLFFLTLPLIKKARTVVTIHDVIPLIYPEKYPPGIRGKLNYLGQWLSLRNVDAVVTDSENSKRDIVRFLKIPEQKVHVVYLAASDELQPVKSGKVRKVMQKYRLKKPYFLYVGDINYNKNVEGLIRSYANFSEKVGLVMVSRALAGDSKEANNIFELIDELRLKSRIKILSDVRFEPMDDMCGLYSGAEWYVQPSFYEGFGLPVIEAMNCEAPVISSTGGSLEEVVSDSALTFDPMKVDALNQVMDKALESPSYVRESLVKKGKINASRFSWNKTAKQMVDVYENTNNV